MTEPPDSPAPEAPPPAAPPLGIDPGTNPVPDGTPRGLVPVLVVLLLVAVAWIVGPTIAGIGKPGPDEFYYLSYSQTVAERGPGAFRDLFRVHVEESRHWQFPSPLRVGYLAFAALWMRTDGVEPQSLGHLSLVSLLASIVVVYRLAAKGLGAARGLCAAALFAASPLGLGMARRALQDSFATLAALLALAAFLVALERPTRGRIARLALVFGFAILTKESLALLALPMAIWIAIETGGGRIARRAALESTLALAASGALALGVWVVAAGSFTTVRRLVEIVLASPATNAYALRFGGGPWWRYLVDFLALSPVPTLLGLAGIALTLDRARRRPNGEPVERTLLFFALLTALTLAEYAFLTKNVRYVMLLDLPLRLFAVEALWRLLPIRAHAARVAATAAVVLLLAAADLRSFRELFLARGLYDPMSAPLLELRGIVPPS